MISNEISWDFIVGSSCMNFFFFTGKSRNFC